MNNQTEWLIGANLVRAVVRGGLLDLFPPPYTEARLWTELLGYPIFQGRPG